MKPLSLAMLLLGITQSAIAHKPINVTAKVLDEHLEIMISHQSYDPNHHYINHVTITSGGRKILDQDFNAQTDGTSLDIQIPHHSTSPRKRIKKHTRIKVYASCNEGVELHRDVIVH